MRYECEDCKDTGYIELLTSTVECDCRKDSADVQEKLPYWVAAYDSYAEYVRKYG